MIKLFDVPRYIIDTSAYNNLLHDEIVDKFCYKFTNYVGAKYGCCVQSATAAIQLCLFDKPKLTIAIPSLLPKVVLDTIILSGHNYRFVDNVNWIGRAYTLYDFGDYKIVDSAQEVSRLQFPKYCNDNDLMIFSFYQTKPISSLDGGIIVSNDKDKIEKLKTLSFYGTSNEQNSWERNYERVGCKLYMNSVQADIAMRNFSTWEKREKRIEEIRLQYNKAFNLTNISNYLYRVPTKNNKEISQILLKHNIQTGIHYPALHLHQLYKSSERLFKSEKQSHTMLSIPLNATLINDEVDYVIKWIKPYVLS